MLSMVQEKTYTGLRRFNAVMGFLHLIQGILMIVISNDTTYPIYTNFLRFDLDTFSLTPDPKLVYNLPFGPAVAVFLLLSAVAHFSLATFGYQWYVKSLKRGMNSARFYEYALSSSLMIVLIGMLVGIWDLGTMIVMFGVNAAMNLFGITMELQNEGSKKINWLNFIYGCFAGIVPWIVVFMYFPGCGGINRSKTSGLCVCDCPHTVRLLQYFRSEYVPAIQKSWSLEELPVWGADVHRVEFVSQDAACLDDFLRYAGTDVSGI